MDNTSPEPFPLNPFGNIALTFSGGGFRAAAFSLGALSYLDRIGSGDNEEGSGIESLLPKVSYISSTSGGSFTNALYSSYIHQGKPFIETYNKLMKEMAGQALLQRVFDVMHDDSQWNQPGNDKQRSFINAFAKVYDSMIFEGETLGVFWNKEHVKRFEVCFNSTEFYRGLSFRFQTEGTNNPEQVMGNKYLHFDARKHIDTIQKLKLADMVAASSCFPAGFEPILYPQDFSYANKEASLTTAELKAAMLYEDYAEQVHTVDKPYGFMDGGITDNQGLYSAMGSDKKRRKRVNGDPFDLIMVTDVTSYFMKEYEQPVEKTAPEFRKKNLDFYIAAARKGIKTFAGISVWAMVISLLLLLAGIGAIVFCDSPALKITGGIVCGATLVLLALILIIKKIGPVQWILKNKNAIEQESTITQWIGKQKFMSEKMMIGLVRFFRTTRLGMLELMIKARVASLLSMVLDINLKQTRRMIYEMFYNDHQWDNRRVPNFIYELSSCNIISRTNRLNSPSRLGWTATDEDKKLLLGNCKTLSEIAEVARTMGTTLWFDENDEGKLKKIIATGQFTTCSNLLEYIISLERKKVPLDDAATKKILALKSKLVKDFEYFKNNPFYLCDIYDKQGVA